MHKKDNISLFGQKKSRKPNLRKIALLFFMSLTLGSCSNDDDNNSSQSLPPETQTGANTVGCLVNGKVFLPHKEGINAPVNCFYQFVDDEFYFTMAFSDLRNGGIETVNIFTTATELEQDQTYILNQGYTPILGGGAEYYLKLSNKFSTNTTQTGELTITRNDLSNSIISGIFWFDAINEAGEVVKIREGRFDWNY